VKLGRLGPIQHFLTTANVLARGGHCENRHREKFHSPFERVQLLRVCEQEVAEPIPHEPTEKEKGEKEKEKGKRRSPFFVREK